MFDIVITSAPTTAFTGRVVTALREARMRVISCEVTPHRPPPDTLRVDAAVACAPLSTTMLDIARSVRAIMDGPPPIIGISGGAQLSSRELTHALPDDVSGATLALHVQRAAALSERRRSKILLRGDLDDVGFDNLLASLSSRNKSCFVRVRSGSHRAEVTLDGGHILHVRADGFDSSDRGGTLRAVGEWRGGTFEVIASEELGPPRSQEETGCAPPLPSSEAIDVALAAAIVNACAAYARAWLGGPLTMSVLQSSWARMRLRHPGLEAFRISNDGMVSVAQVDRARLGLPVALAEWIVQFFEAAAKHQPARFQKAQIRNVLGGLMRMVEQVGWASALFEGNDP
jgi:Domain of unknown function (DUF4388)